MYRKSLGLTRREIRVRLCGVLELLLERAAKLGQWLPGQVEPL